MTGWLNKLARSPIDLKVAGLSPHEGTGLCIPPIPPPPRACMGLTLLPRRSKNLRRKSARGVFSFPPNLPTGVAPWPDVPSVPRDAGAGINVRSTMLFHCDIGQVLSRTTVSARLCFALARALNLRSVALSLLYRVNPDKIPTRSTIPGFNCIQRRCEKSPASDFKIFEHWRFAYNHYFSLFPSRRWLGWHVCWHF